MFHSLLFVALFSLFSFSNFALATEIDCHKLLPAPVEIVTLDSIDMQEVKFFSSDEGSLSLFTKSPHKSKTYGISPTINDLILKITGSKSGSFVALESVGSLMNEEPSLIKDIRGGSWPAKKKLIRILKGLNIFINTVRPDPIPYNLLAIESWHRLLGTKDAAEIYALSNADSWIASPSATEEGVGVRTISVVGEAYKQMAYELIPVTQELMTNRIGVVNSIPYEHFDSRLVELLQHLHLPKAREEFYLEMFEYAKAESKFNTAGIKYAKRFEVIFKVYFFSKAFFEVFPDKQPKDPLQIFLAPVYNSYGKTASDFHHFYEITEQRLEENLNNALQLNSQIDALQADIQTALTAHSRLEEEMGFENRINEISSEAMSLRANDISTDMTTAESSVTLSRLHFELNHIIEKILKTSANEAIRSFSELNFSWQRVLPDHSYEIEGRDFDKVVFSDDVVKFFEKDGSRAGDRFLAAIAKGYVGLRNESGIRVAPDIHKDFRYLKIMKAHGKVRLLGKVEGRTLYFFDVFNRDENFDQVKIRHQVEKKAGASRLP